MGNSNSFMIERDMKNDTKRANNNLTASYNNKAITNSTNTINNGNVLQTGKLKSGGLTFTK